DARLHWSIPIRPIGRIDMNALQTATPQCILCKSRPTTPRGYTEHLRRNHKTTLNANGIYLICSCGVRYNNGHDTRTIDKKCIEHDFATRKLDKITTPQCVLCE
ncbi:hypothetical protein PMAYCL1PPCAC_01490, partial [Pristionchus mayeri]